MQKTGMKKTGHGVVHTVLCFMVATVVTYTLASLAHTQQVISNLQGLGVTVNTGDWVRVITGDWLGLYLYLAVIAIGLAIGFTTMSVLKAYWQLPGVGVLLFAFGGALAMCVMLVAMKQLGSITPIAGARGTTGLLLQCAAGMIGGVVYALLKSREGPSTR